MDVEKKTKSTGDRHLEAIGRMVERYRELGRGIKTKTLVKLLYILDKYCTGRGVMVDLVGRYRREPGVRVVSTVPEFVRMLMEREGMCRRSAYDYAYAIRRIQALV